VIADILKSTVPLAYEAFEDYLLNSISLSYQEQKAVALLLNNFSQSQISEILNNSTLNELGLGKRDSAELIAKINNIITK
jgi:hypothetical protein